MKRITAYVNPTRVRLIIGELGSEDVKEMKVVAYFKPLSEASRIDLLCEESSVDKVRGIIRNMETNGSLPDHLISISDFKPKPIERSTVGKRMGQLDD